MDSAPNASIDAKMAMSAHDSQVPLPGVKASFPARCRVLKNMSTGEGESGGQCNYMSHHRISSYGE
jgi:hypothetical protein